MIEDTEPKDISELHESIIDKYRTAKTAWNPIFADYLNDCRFVEGDQWDPKVKKQREDAFLQVLVNNKVASYVNQIVNQSIKATASIKCAPVGEGANKNTAKVYDGLIKYILYSSDAKVAINNGHRNIVTGGIGAIKIDVEDGMPIVERVKDPTSILMDPTANRSNFSDAEYIFEEKWITKKLYKQLYGDDNISGIGKGYGYNADMFNVDSVLLLEYWCKEENELTGQLEVKKYVLNGDKILGIYDWYGSMFPIIYFTGTELYIENDRKYKGVVRDLKDIQRMLNLATSRIADYSQRSSLPQWMVTPKNVEDNVDKWNKVNVNGDGVLIAEPDANGIMPQQIQAPPPPVGFQSVSQTAEADLRSGIGIRDVSQDLPDGISNKTLELHIAQSNIGTYGFDESINNAIKYMGQVLVDIIPNVITGPKMMEIMGNDGNISSVMLNQPYIENGKIVHHDLKSGKYSVLISTGPSYQSRRDEALDKLMELAKVDPTLLQVAGDIIYRNMDFEGASEIADRKRAQIPPEILAASNPTNDDDNQAQLLQNNLIQAQQQMQQMQMQMQQMDQMIQQLNQEKAAKLTEINAKAEADKALKQMEFEHEKELKLMDIDSKSQLVAEKGLVDVNVLNHKTEIELGKGILDNHNKIFHAKMAHELGKERNEIAE